METINNKLKYEKVYGWQQGLYPYLDHSDAVESSSANVILVTLSKEHSILFFAIGLENLEFLVERKEDSEEIGYPKTIAVSKIRDFVRKEILDPKESWEWVYVGYEQDSNKCSLHELLVNNSSDYIWLKPSQKPLYTLRKKANFSKLENAYGITKTFLKRKINTLSFLLN